jgi:toxin-antitoxin system PIN domain toxin
MFLPDINVWVALAFELHPHYTACNVWFEESSDTCCFCRLTQQGFLRLASNRAALKEQVVTLRKAWHLYDDMLSDRRVVFAEEPEGIEHQWRAFTQRRTFSPKVWNDAYLAAFAKCADWELVSFDKALAQFKGVKCTILS